MIRDKFFPSGIEISEILIKEQKQLRQEQKMRKIFGEDDAFAAKNKIDDGAEPIKSRNDDLIKKMIALQIIERNMAQNNNVANKTADGQKKN